MLPEWDQGPLLERKGLWSCLPRLPIDRRWMATEDPVELLPVVQEPVEQEDPRLAGRGFAQAPDWEQQVHWEQQGCPDWPEELLR